MVKANPIDISKLGSISELEERLDRNTFYSPDGCWYWTGSVKVTGYGIISVKDRLYAAHRISYAIRKGPVNNLFICHTCDNPKCINPDHLWMGTDMDNVLDKVQKGRCFSGSGELNGLAKLTEKQVLEIRSLNGKVKPIEIAKKYSMSRTGINHILTRSTWKHLH